MFFEACLFFEVYLSIFERSWEYVNKVFESPFGNMAHMEEWLTI
jgi:hypothetical protein